jgi:hypothetical protein
MDKHEIHIVPYFYCFPWVHYIQCIKKGPSSKFLNQINTKCPWFLIKHQYWEQPTMTRTHCLASSLWPNTSKSYWINKQGNGEEMVPWSSWRRGRRTAARWGRCRCRRRGSRAWAGCQCSWPRSTTCTGEWLSKKNQDQRFSPQHLVLASTVKKNLSLTHQGQSIIVHQYGW